MYNVLMDTSQLECIHVIIRIIIANKYTNKIMEKKELSFPISPFVLALRIPRGTQSGVTASPFQTRNPRLRGKGNLLRE